MSWRSGDDNAVLFGDVLFLRSFKLEVKGADRLLELRPGLAGGMAEVARAPLNRHVLCLG